MAIYRFRVSFEDYDDVVREIDIRSTQTFVDLHRAIHSTTGYNTEQSSSFFVSNDYWIKKDEIAYLPTQRKIDRGVILMENSKLNSYIDDPHQKFYYTYNFDRPYDFHVELIKILDDEKGKEYPVVVRSAGEAPKPLGPIAAPVAAAAADAEDFDFLNEMEYAAEDTEDLEEVDDLGLVAVSPDEHDEEEKGEDEFLDDFSDNDNFDADDFPAKEDY